MVTRNAQLIAIVEDDQTLAGTYQQVLEEEGGWRTLVVDDGEEALHRLPELHPDLILLDMMLPGLDGAALYRLLRARPETARTPILIVTASQVWKLHRVGLEPSAYLHKPFEVADLLSAVAALLADPPDPPADTE
jgi:DNA-binding response OmpR family regulator